MPTLPRKECWGVGLLKSPHEFGMTDGPFSTESEALEIIGDERSRIIHFLSDGSAETTWWWGEDCWVQRENPKKY